MYKGILDTRIAGIPCKIGITSLTIDRRFGSEADFHVMDRRGRLAPWLDRKLTEGDYERIVDEIVEAMA
jgi:hypothetical protein